MPDSERQTLTREEEREKERKAALLCLYIFLRSTEATLHLTEMTSGLASEPKEKERERERETENNFGKQQQNLGSAGPTFW